MVAPKQCHPLVQPSLMKIATSHSLKRASKIFWKFARLLPAASKNAWNFFNLYPSKAFLDLISFFKMAYTKIKHQTFLRISLCLFFVFSKLLFLVNAQVLSRWWYSNHGPPVQDPTEPTPNRRDSSSTLLCLEASKIILRTNLKCTLMQSYKILYFLGTIKLYLNKLMWK